VTKGITATGKKAVVDAYNGLKKIISSKFGRDSQVSKAIAELEADPDSKGLQTILLEQVVATTADQDSQILEITQELIKALNRTEAGRKAIARFQIDAKDVQVGVIGDHAHIQGGIHFGESKK
jgi:hypothetical protein